MNNLEKELAPPTEAWEMKNLGFNENCFASYYKAGYVLDINEYSNQGKYTFLAPTFSQALRWFRDRHDIFSHFDKHVYKYYYHIHHSSEALSDTKYFDTYEEAELACLRKLIEIVKTNKP